jgi:hypothetical protein
MRGKPSFLATSPRRCRERSEAGSMIHQLMWRALKPKWSVQDTVHPQCASAFQKLVISFIRSRNIPTMGIVVNDFQRHRLRPFQLLDGINHHAGQLNGRVNPIVVTSLVSAIAIAITHCCRVKTEFKTRHIW